MRAADLLTTIAAGAAGAALAVALVGASLLLVVPAIAAVGVVTLVADRVRHAR